MVSEAETNPKGMGDEVLILVLVEDGLGGNVQPQQLERGRVLILVLVEDGLGGWQACRTATVKERLNPCSSGRWSRRYGTKIYSRAISVVLILVLVEDGLGGNDRCTQGNVQPSLNPCSSGRWSRSRGCSHLSGDHLAVLILVLVEDGLGAQMAVQACASAWS